MRYASYDNEYPNSPPQLRRPAPFVIPAEAGIQRGMARPFALSLSKGRPRS